MPTKKAGGHQMANLEHLEVLKRVTAWNTWRKQHPEIEPDLSGARLIKADLSTANLFKADLSGADLSFANLSRADLSTANLFRAYLRDTDLREANLSKAYLIEADLSKANLFKADLSGARLIGAIFSGAHLSGAHLSEADLRRAELFKADLSGVDLSGAYLEKANLREANLSGANLRRADLRRADLLAADLSGADLSEANLSEATLVRANFTKAILTNCSVYGIAAWNVELEGATQDSLIITPDNEPTITVDNLKIAQFIYLLLNNSEIRDVINTLTTKSVLILGRFTLERKAVLDTLREALRQHNYLPILFDFEKPASRDITETISTLAHLARFVVADITDAKSIPQELQTIVPNLPSVPVQPLILASQHEYGMFEHFIRFPWVLPIYRYRDEVNLLQSLQEKVIAPAEQKAKELEKR